MNLEGLKKLKKLAASFSLLYVEDNDGLREQAATFFKKTFPKVYTARDGLEGLELFQKHHCPIVITDITMPKMDGLVLSKKIKEIDPQIEIILTSAHNDEKNLLAAIDLGVYKFIIKPLPLAELAETLIKCTEKVLELRHRNLFTMNLHNIFNYQDNFVMMMKNSELLMANEKTIAFFGYSNLHEMKEDGFDLGLKLLEHDKFLFNDKEDDYFDVLKESLDTLFHVKIADTKNVSHHFMARLSAIAEKKDNYILSLNDITELNLLDLFDHKSMKHEKAVNNKESILNLFKMLQKNSGELKINSFYRAIKITNPAVVVDVIKNEVTLKTSYKQQKAVQYEKKMILSSNTFPYDILAESIINNSYETQSINVQKFSFLIDSPTQRTHVRVEPGESAQVTLFFEERNAGIEMHILDVSIDALSINMNGLPVGMQKGSKVQVDMVFQNKHKPLIINTAAKIESIKEEAHSYLVILSYEIHERLHMQFVEYLAARQMELIREFKGLIS